MSQDHLGALATWNQLALFSIASAIIVIMLMISTSTGDPVWTQRLGAEMGTINKAIKAVARGLYAAAWHTFVSTVVFIRDLGKTPMAEYAGRHRVLA